MGCDMCGANGSLFLTKVEGTEMQLCSNCKQYGEVIRRIPTTLELKKAVKKKDSFMKPAEEGEVIQLVVKDYGRRIKNARESKNLKQEELAKKLAIKEAQLHKYENGSLHLDLDTAKIFENALGIILVEEHKEKKGAYKTTESGPMTIGDMIKFKK